MSRTSVSRKRALKSSVPLHWIAATNSFVKRSAVVRAHAQAAAVLADVVADRVQQVGLAEAGRAVEKERVVGLAGHLGDRQGGGVGEAVGVADDELVERELGMELGLGLALEAAVGGGGGRCALVDSGARARRRRPSSRPRARRPRTSAGRGRSDRPPSCGSRRARVTISVSPTTARGRSGGEPDLEGRVRHGPAQLRLDQRPVMGELRGDGRRDRLLRRGPANDAEGPGERPGRRRIYQRPVAPFGGAAVHAAQRGKNRAPEHARRRCASIGRRRQPARRP